MSVVLTKNAGLLTKDVCGACEKMFIVSMGENVFLKQTDSLPKKKDEKCYLIRSIM